MVHRARDVGAPVSNALWGRAAGRCEFDGCNKQLWRSSVTQEEVNIAQKAHIYSFSEQGPRGHADIDEGTLNDAENLILVCHECHQKIDKEKDGGRYTAELLREWKAAHEERVELVTGIVPSKKTHVLLFGANIGQHSSPLSARATAPVVFPQRYPAQAMPIKLGMTNSSWTDKDDLFWSIEAGNLRKQYADKVQEKLISGEIEHLSIFGLAPQPLLILLGTLITDIPAADVYQLHREPSSWAWNEDEPVNSDFTYESPPENNGAPALILAVSATITSDRVLNVLGNDAAIWRMTIPQPSSDFLQSRNQLRAFRVAMRSFLDDIKARHGQEAPLHIFPAMPVAAAIDLGRIRMPKADMAWHIYDQASSRGGFVHALTLDVKSAGSSPDGDAR